MKKLFLFFLTGICSLLLLWLLQDSQKVVYGETAAAASSVSATTVFLPSIMTVNQQQPQFPAPLFGVQMYSSTDNDTPYYPFLIDSQANWLRSRAAWSNVEPTNTTVANYSWGSTDQAMAAARADRGGLHIIAVIDLIPEWAQLIPGAVSGPIDPDKLDDFAEFVQATVERYDGDGYQDAPGRPTIRHWELFNEPDGSPNRWGDYGTEYAAMLAIAYPAIKAADPNAQVIFGGMAYDWFDYQGGPFVYAFLDNVLAAGGGNYFDIMNFHMYPLFASNWGSLSTGLKGKTAAIRTKLAEYGLNKPVIITEAGWHNSTDADPPSSDAEQMARLVQLMAQSYASDIKVTVWFMLHDPGDFLPDYGLITAGDFPAPKKAYTAYQTAVSFLNDAQFVQDLSQADSGSGLETLELYQFTTPGGALYTGWINPYTSTETRIVSIQATAVDLINPQGAVIGTAVDDNGDGFVSVTLKNQPIYVQVTSP